MVPIKAALCLGIGGRVIKAIHHTENTSGCGRGEQGGERVVGGGAFDVT